MVAAYSNKDEKHLAHLDSLVSKYHIGGLIFFQGGPLRQAYMTNRYQLMTKVPLFIAIDAEWGLSMRLDSAIQFPHQLTLGAIRNNTLIYDMGREIARQCKRMGIHINFAPVVDVNNNPNNPVINDRSFGENKYNVALKGLAYMQGLQDGGVMACAKHFPGHGDTDTDSHYALPVINKSLQQLDTLELYPFKILFNEGIRSVMAAHLFIPKIDSTPNTATSLSAKSTTRLLKEKMGFKGLVFSDALNMKGVSKFFAPGEVELKAFMAGNDVLLFAEDVPKAVSLMKNAIRKKLISQQQIALAVKKILLAKYDYGLTKPQLVNPENLYEDLNDINAVLLQRKLFEAALTIAADEKNQLPVIEFENKKFASLCIGTTSVNEFQQMLSNYIPVTHFTIDKNATTTTWKKLADTLKHFTDVIVGIHDMTRHAHKNYGLTDDAIQFVKTLAAESNLILAIFGNPYSLQFFDLAPCVIMAYEDNNITRSLVAQVIFGAKGADGLLPVSATAKYYSGCGKKLPGGLRLQYTLPEEAGIASKYLRQIDTIAAKAIREKMTPGCQIVFAKDGKIFYQKSFGYHTYDSLVPVSNTDIYDVASITKVAATTISLMKLYDEGKFYLDKYVSDYLPETKKTPIGRIKLHDILLHQAGLPAWIPFYQKYLSETERKKWFRIDEEKHYHVPVARHLYAKNTLVDTIYKTIYNTKPDKKPEYRYSDLGFYLLSKIIHRLAGEPLDEYARKTFYAPLGLSNTAFTPWQHFPDERIVPTEIDTIFRKQTIHGYVHDPGAALLGGVSGHAGLFSNATDLTILFQMLLNKGSYGGKRYLSPSTVEMFTRTHLENNRRGLGFDKPDTDTTKTGPTAKSASPDTFGHTGFTGTCAWADPKHNLIYVFLSNRTYPYATNNKLAQENIRTRIMQVVYDAIYHSQNEH
jgi:beta-glucosidase-like glycosyl hydrolase/CubicO group peptidase (beta-lactamase class C family)